MSILDANADSLQTAATNSVWSEPPKTPKAGIFDNFGASAGNYFMRSMAEAGRSASMAVGALPVLADKAVSPESMLGQALGDKSLSDRYFAFHDRLFGRAVDYWTPRPEEVGAAGQITGSLAGGLVQFLANPALAVANAQLSTSEELVRQGVDAGAALVAGDFAALGTVAGIKIPIMGSTLVQRLATGVAGNVGQSVATAAATQAVLKSAEAPDRVVQQFDPFDPKARTVDLLMGLAFGAKAHIDARAELTQTQRDAIMLVNQARHLEDSALPGRPADAAGLTKAVDGTRTAMDQMLRGDPIAVDEPLPHFEVDPARVAERADMAKIVADELPAATPIARPQMIEPEAPKPAADPQAEAQAPKPFADSVRLPSGEFDPKTGEALTISANDFVARATAEADNLRTTAKNLLTTAAECLLGSL